MARAARREAQLPIIRSQFALLTGMALGLALFGWGGALPAALAGLLLFGVLALLRPDLALLFVPLTAPLYLIPAAIPGLRSDSSKPFMLPLYEAALLVVAAAALAGWGWRLIVSREPRATSRFDLGALLREYAPQLLFLVAGIWGLAIAIDRGPALIEFRRLIAEPLIFYALIRSFDQRAYSSVDAQRLSEKPLSWGVGGLRPPRNLSLARHLAVMPPDGAPEKEIREAHSLFQTVSQDSQPALLHSPYLLAFIVGGAIVGLLGLLQYAGLDLVPYLGAKQCFAPDGGVCSNIVLDGGVRRVLSVYGHPNNLGLYLGRVWPLAAALALVRFRTKNQEPRTSQSGSWFLVLGCLLCLGGIVVSFSRGAWLAALAALAVLALPILRARLGSRAAPALAGLGVLLAALAGLGLTVRGDLAGGSTPVRLLLWREALGYIQLHPLGIGLDQFVQYHDPSSGRSLIDPSLIGTSEQYAAHPHNLLLDTWLRLGPLGVLAFGWLLARFFRAGRARLGHPLALGALAAITAALVHGLVDNFYFVPDLALAFWLLLALMEVVPDRYMRDSAEDIAKHNFPIRD